MPTIPGVEGVQDAVFSSPFPGTFAEFGERHGFSIAQKLVDEILLELAAYEHIQHVSQSTKIEGRPTIFTFPSIFFYLPQGNTTAFRARQHLNTRSDLI